MQIALFEGISGAGKTTLIRHIRQRLSHDPYSKFTHLFFSEHMTIRVFESAHRNKSLLPQDVSSYLGGLVEMLNTLGTAHAQSPFNGSTNPVCQVFIERFGISHYLGQYFAVTDMLPLFEKMSRLPATVVLFHLTLPKQKIIENLEMSLSHRNAAWASYLAEQGGLEAFAHKLELEQTQAQAALDLVSPYIKVIPLDMSCPDYEKTTDIIISALSNAPSN